jgi:hypothetical protein
MPVAVAVGITMPRFGSFISQTGVRVTRYSGRVDWSGRRRGSVGILDRQLLGIGVRPGACPRPADRPDLVLGGFLALFQGFSQIMLAFSIRHAREEAAAIDSARPRDVSTCSVGTTRRRNVPALAA